MLITIDNQISCLKDEMKRRASTYRVLIEQGRMTPKKAAYEIAVMAQVYQTITQLKGIVAGKSTEEICGQITTTDSIKSEGL